MTARSMRRRLPADIPSPSSGVLEIGPLSIHAYGLMIALGVVAAVWLAGRRLEAKGVGTRDDMSAIALWAVPAGVIGAAAVPRDHRLGAVRGRPRRASRRSGRAASASPAASSPASSSGCGAAQAARHRPGCARRLRSAGASRSRRRSAGGATTSTRSCSASRPTCRGRCEVSDDQGCAGGLRRRARRSTRRSSTSRCGTWRSSACCC